ncbi:hypothetical protein AB4225_22880 [Streptomyces sp. 2RAF24]|uniref:hypothetical protein n=1 Tax=unclassified Streptomyces TaxID=2593676 RepID=UPI0033FFEDBD
MRRSSLAIGRDASLAYLTHLQTKNGGRPQDKEWEWTVHGLGKQGSHLADQLEATVRAWDRHVRADDTEQHAAPVLTVYPAGTPDGLLPAGDVLDKDPCRLVFRWPGRDVPRPRHASSTRPSTRPSAAWSHTSAKSGPTS